MKTIRKSFPKIRTYIRRRKRRFEVDARGNGVGRRFYFTNRTTAFTKAKEIAALVQPRTEAAPLRPRSFSSLVFAARRFRDIFTDLALQTLNRERVEAVFSKQKWS